MKREEQEKAKVLRKKGYSLKEIQLELGVAKSSVSYWVRDVSLSEDVKKRLKSKLSEGQLVAQEAKRRQTKQKWDDARQWARSVLRKKKTSKHAQLLLCAMIFWCEGTKKIDQGIVFTNSDQRLVSYFLKLFRESFEVDESRFRVLVHLHDYHHREEQLNFWSKITKIPRAQFMKPYQKPNTGKRYRDSYQGCVQIRYCDVSLARHLSCLAEEMMNA